MERPLAPSVSRPRRADGGATPTHTGYGSHCGCCLLGVGVGGSGLSLGNKTRRKGLLVVARTLDDSKALLPLKQKREKKVVFQPTLYHSLAAFGG